ncbi:MAG TPA: MXAN_6230/SCO0854 family RING domain-containing protein [Kribbella sp.]|uniref:MXAN_6230/SCO0854 family RING domain-containing protein n=1 Tax=Kribbella sp. TaxID=1871183 RepID=UPI002D76D9B5|nr:MXAN_6230/SCO0854 family RING domain-containing protein [Kribbella sp.]HET6297556.1 MXAN_6230/SCO0854 family RING domain-containing protein [Kribbella sp.]
MPDALAAVLLRRRRLVDAARLTPPVRRSAWHWLRHPLSTQAGLSALQADLIQRGFLLSATLYRYCVGLNPLALTGFGRDLLELLDQQSGRNASHVPLFRGFPETVPGNTETFYIDRTFARLLQEPEQPCVLCGESQTVHPVSPCAHLVCRNCWDGADYSACPICLRQIDKADPFLEPSEDEAIEPARADRLRLLTLATDDSARTTAAELLVRRAPLSVGDRADLKVLLTDADPSWLPDFIPVRETRAIVLAHFLPTHPALIDELLDTATDALRLLYVLMGADPGLRTPPVRRTSLARAIRRTVLDRLDKLPLESLVEDMLRHQRAWKRIAENLHPLEFATRYPVAALAFAVVRGTTVDGGSPAGRAILSEATGHPAIRLEDGRLVMNTFASRVESAFATERPSLALDLLTQRPGDLLRRLVQLARALPPDAHGSLIEAVTTAVSDVSPVVLTAALGQVRTPPGDLRLFFPRGGTTRIWTAVDEREPLPTLLAGALAAVLVGELLRRATALPRVRRAFLDEELARLAAPGSERSASSTLRRMTRGSTQPIPEDDLLRLFVHWVEPAGQRVDLNLSVMVLDSEWAFVGLCDYTRLRFDQDALVHSGDLTSAPGKAGSSEYIDIDLAALKRVGGRYLLPVVFSYNNVPFDRLERGFVGVMRQPSGLFDPTAVEERFDLTGPAKILLPFGIDLHTKELRWYDVNLSAVGYGHSIVKYGGAVALMAAAIEEVHGAGDRVSLWELCCWHAAARTDEVVVRTSDGSIVGYLRGEGEDVSTFARRLTARLEPDRYWDLDAASRADFVAVITADLDPKAGAEVYALHPHLLDPGSVNLIDAPHLLAALTPDTRAHQTLLGRHE